MVQVVLFVEDEDEEPEDGAGVGVSVGVGEEVGVATGSKIILPNAVSVVEVVVSVTSIGSVPAVVDVAEKVAIPDESVTRDVGEILIVASVPFESCIVSPTIADPDESLRVMVITDCVAPSAGTSVAERLEFVASGGFPA